MNLRFQQILSAVTFLTLLCTALPNAQASQPPNVLFIGIDDTRTERYRFNAWKDGQNLHADPIEVELYDHEKDPMEMKNIAKQNPKLVEQRLARMNAGWEASLPGE